MKLLWVGVKVRRPAVSFLTYTHTPTNSPGKWGRGGGGRDRDSIKSCCPWCFTRCTSLQICWKVTCGTEQASGQH